MNEHSTFLTLPHGHREEKLPETEEQEILGKTRRERVGWESDCREAGKQTARRSGRRGSERKRKKH